MIIKARDVLFDTSACTQTIQPAFGPTRLMLTRAELAEIGEISNQSQATGVRLTDQFEQSKNHTYSMSPALNQWKLRALMLPQARVMPHESEPLDWMSVCNLPGAAKMTLITRHLLKKPQMFDEYACSQIAPTSSGEKHKKSHVSTIS